MKAREAIEWCDIWVEKGDISPSQRVLLIGDSITRSYHPHVSPQLPATVGLARISTSKCACDPLFLTELSLLLGEYTFDVIHFNNGLHGWDYTEEQYGEGLKKSFDHLLQYCRPNKLIWAHSTPVRRSGQLAEWDILNARVLARNQLATTHATSRGIPINDLYAVAEKHPEYYLDDGIHYADSGCKALAAQVVTSILAVPTDKP